MAKESKHVQIGRRRLELSNLSKVLYPQDNFVKAEVVEYYLKISPTILSHIKGRALSLIRFPDGIEGERFFQKNRPEWAPDWLEYVTLGTEKKDYIMATEEASLAWLANMACLELHQMHTKRPHHDLSDYIVYDLDPPEDYSFEDLKVLAFSLKDHIEAYDYQCFVKTTGGKGLHLLTPVQAKWTVDECFDAAKEIAETFIKREKQTTLNIKKDARKGRVLIDIYRNRSSQTIVAPYSLRGYPGAPVSMPISWNELEEIESSQAFNIKSAPERVLDRGDAWEGMGAYAVVIHTKRKGGGVRNKLEDSSHYKSPEQLKAYSGKRDFTKTPEPAALFSGGDGTGFVVHRHHASHLHYDLRLEEAGALRSWAVPKGMPSRPGIKRLAMETEDHPLEYITFEGEIPKGQYGGGKMWIYANGRHEVTKKKKDGFYFTLSSPELNAEYRMHRTKGKEWLLERVDKPQIDWLNPPVQLMLAETSSKVPEGDEYIYELMWNGIRASIIIDEGEVHIFSSEQKPLKQQFPELLSADKAFRATCGVFDAVIVCFDKAGKPDSKAVNSRMGLKGEAEIEKSAKVNPAYCYVFDCLYLDGRSLINDPLLRRREWMEDNIRRNTPYRVSEALTEGKELFQAAKGMQLNGIMAKDKTSKYLPGKRTRNWLKIKIKN